MIRIKETFNNLKKDNKTAFISFVTGGDPDLDTSLSIIKQLPENGTDIIEIGIPFLDPAGDGPVIEEAGKRAIKNGATLKKILEMVTSFRKSNDKTPIILMGYYNSVLHYGLEKFTIDAKKCGVDGLLIVDLPIEEDDELHSHCQQLSLGFIKLITPTTNKERMKKIIAKASGFIYFVSIAGITGTKSSDPQESKKIIDQIKDITDIPVAIGFGIKNKQQVEEMSNIGANGVIVGSRLVGIIEKGVNNNQPKDSIAKELLQVNQELSG
jgi:tryptophan synthase alpha chain